MFLCTAQSFIDFHAETTHIPVILPVGLFLPALVPHLVDPHYHHNPIEDDAVFIALTLMPGFAGVFACARDSNQVAYHLMVCPAEGGTGQNTKKVIVLTSPIKSFSDLPLVEPLQRAIAADGYTTPTPIQAQAIPMLLQGRDLIGCAQTGTGKTAAFALPLLQRLYDNPAAVSSKCTRILVLSPTRELATQIHESFGSYGRFLNLRRTTIFGGVSSQGQIKAMARGVDVLVATPGRLLDLMNQGRVCLDEVEAFVLDEADRMLDMGFIPDIRKIAAKVPEIRQTLMFSATMEPRIAKLAKSLLRNPARVDVAPESTTAETVEQKIMFVDRANKVGTLLELLDNGIYKAMVFTRTKHGANRLDAQLHKSGVKAMAIHGNKSMNARKKALEAFQKGHLQVLVATDVAARGLDIDDVTHVINYDMPDQPDAYVHRIGRTGRAGADGIAISLVDGSERHLLRAIERTINQKLSSEVAPTPKQRPKPQHIEPRDVSPEDDIVQNQRSNGQRDGKPFHAKKKPHRGPKGPNGRRPDEQKSGDRKPHGNKKPWHAASKAEGKSDGFNKGKSDGADQQKRHRKRRRKPTTQPELRRAAA
ncbi:MAG: DEAD/DEAH box helicase [Rhodospirillaceae bacterium]